MASKCGRKNLKRTVNDEILTLQSGQSIMQVVSLRGSYVVVDDSGREKAIESGRKVACVVLQVLFHEQVRVLQKSPEWPEIFKTAVVDSSVNSQQTLSTTHENEELDSSNDDGLPPLEANTNRRIHVELKSDTESDSDIEDS